MSVTSAVFVERLQAHRKQNCSEVAY